MRMMLKVHVDIEAGNLAIGDGSIGKVFEMVFGLCRPEASWFLVEGGKRTCYAIFDLLQPSVIPELAEPLFQSLGATVEVLPVMSAAELEAGLKAWSARRA